MTVEPTQRVPIAVDEKGFWRVEGTRVGVDVILQQYLDGASADQIAEDFPSVIPCQIYGIIAYYLQHRDEVNAYLKEAENKASVLRDRIDSESGNRELRELLQTRRVAREAVTP